MEFVTLFTALNEGACLLTANNRLARAINLRYNQYQLAQGLTVWSSARVLPIEAWLRLQFVQLQMKQVSEVAMINPLQQQLIWQRILLTGIEVPPLLNHVESAHALQEAWKIANAWGYSFAAEKMDLSYDQTQFLHWAQEYKAYCKQYRLIDDSTLPGYLADDEKLKQIKLPKQIKLLGFYELTPQQLHFFDCLQRLGVSIDKPRMMMASGQQVSRVSPTDDTLELEMSAIWARQSLENDPECEVAIVVPDLDKRKVDILRQFNRIFYPNLSPKQVENESKPFNISLGEALIGIPIVKSALLVLKLVVSALDSSELTQFLLCRFIVFSESEQNQRSILDSNPLIRRRSNTSLNDLIEITRNSQSRLHLSLMKIQRLDVKEKRMPSQWVSSFRQLLELAAWPGEQVPDSNEFQQVESLQNAMLSLSAFDRISGQVSATEALSALHLVASQTVFQPQNSESPIQILGLLESTGLSFDKVWVCSMDDESWPMRQSTTPFLSLQWQRQVGVPHANANKQLDYLQFQLKQLKAAGSEVIFSHVSQRDDNRLSCAHVLLELPLIKGNQWLRNQSMGGVISLQSLEDYYGPSIAQGQYISGGSALLADQAACPFRAFVLHRLCAREFESTQLGVDPRERGNFIHQMLELFWNEIKDQNTLLNMDAEKIQHIIVNLADKVMEDYTNLQRISLHEKKYLIKLAIQWLQEEKKRPGFSVEATEELRELDFQGIKLRLMVDRIDVVTTDDGENYRLIIDYKSGGIHKPAGWLADRPDEPQLPLYAITDEHEVDGACFALLNPNEQGFKGFACRDDLIEKVGLAKKSNYENPRSKVSIQWHEVLSDWRKNLGHLASEICNGNATVTPKPKACLWCPLSSVCRITESRGVQS